MHTRLQTITTLFAFGLGTLFFPARSWAAAHPSRGLWVGEVTLNRVNETVSAVNAANQVVSPDPSVTTPTADAAHLRLILHVDANGTVRLLKDVALLNKSSNSVPDIALVTDESLFPNFPDGGTRFASVAYDFGDKNAYDAVNMVATNIAVAAAGAANAGGVSNFIYSAALSAGNLAVGNAGGLPAPLTSDYLAFVASSTYVNSPQATAQAATSAAVDTKAIPGVVPLQVFNAARSAALKAIDDVFTAADLVPLRELQLNGSLQAGGTVTGTLFLGAAYPTNPFRHRRNPNHRKGYDIFRALTLTVNTPPGGGSFEPGGFGVDRLTGAYREEIQGLHKPLGPGKDIGLITEGEFTLNRISLVDVLNQ